MVKFLAVDHGRMYIEKINNKYIKIYQIAIFFPKGFVITFHHNFSISKDGINRIVRREASCWFLFIALWARILGSLEAALYLISLPFMLGYYVPICVSCFLLSILLCPFQLVCKEFYKQVMSYFKLSLMSIIIIIGHLIMLPTQISLPEINFLIFRTHLWGPTLVGFENEKSDCCGCV